MAFYRTTIILKTDIVDSTPKLAGQTQVEMGLQRKQHNQFISETAAKYHGSVFQEEGDAFWIEFPSVTDAVLSAIDMHQSLRTAQAGKGENQRLAIRAVVTVGDILHQEKDTIGMCMSLTARIEKITPPDEIYLSGAAWLVLNKAEVQTSFVGEFNLKGFSEPEKVYKVDRKVGIRVLTNHYIVLADAKGFSKFFNSHSTEEIEKFLLEYDNLMNNICARHSGVVRQVSGDMYFLTFMDANQTIAALRMLCQDWSRIKEYYNFGISIGVHKGNLHVFRDYVFGNDINTTGFLSELGRFYEMNIDKVFAAISGSVKDEVSIAFDDIRFQELDPDQISHDSYRAVVRENRVYRFMIEGDE
jgi:class 3 adenylate cyclase